MVHIALSILVCSCISNEGRTFVTFGPDYTVALSPEAGNILSAKKCWPLWDRGVTKAMQVWPMYNGWYTNVGAHEDEYPFWMSQRHPK
jgi:hypothetical protein